MVNKDYELIRGDTKKLNKFQITDSSGTVLDLTGAELFFTVKKNSKSNTVLIQKTLSNDGITYSDGYYHITLEAEDTSEMNYGDYQYDIELKTDNYTKTIVMGNITLNEEITFAGDEV